jgi:hypothetical protein
MCELKPSCSKIFCVHSRERPSSGVKPDRVRSSLQKEKYDDGYKDTIKRMRLLDWK